MLLKKTLFIVFVLMISIQANAKVFLSMSQMSTKEMAIQEATWKGFENALMNIVGEDMEGSIVNSFKKDMEMDFYAFKRKYTDFSTYQCQDLKDDGFYCEVQSNINFRKLRSHIKKKSKNSTTMGGNKLSKLDIAIINNVATKESESFLKSLISAVNKSGNNLYILDKGTQVGLKGNYCKEIKRSYEELKKKGSSYKKAIYKARKKLEECKENKGVEYAFSLDEITFKKLGKTELDEYEGILTCEISMRNSQTGKRNKSIETIVVQDVDSSIEKLRLYLYQKAAIEVSEKLNYNMYDYIADKNLNSNNLFYTVILMGLTSDRLDRNKLRLVRNAIKKIGYKPIKNKNESNDFEQVYNFNANKNFDIEDFIDELYDLSDSTSIPIQISENGNNILNVQFQ